MTDLHRIRLPAIHDLDHMLGEAIFDTGPAPNVTGFVYRGLAAFCEEGPDDVADRHGFRPSLKAARAEDGRTVSLEPWILGFADYARRESLHDQIDDKATIRTWPVRRFIVIATYVGAIQEIRGPSPGSYRYPRVLLPTRATP